MDENSAAFLFAAFHRGAEAIGVLPEAGGNQERLATSFATLTAALGLLYYQPVYAAQLAALVIPHAVTPEAASGFARLAEALPISYLKEFTGDALR